MSLVDVLPNGCWFWTGARSRGKGNRKWYGTFYVKGRRVRAHRFSCDVLGAKGPLPPGMHRSHSCHFSLCVNYDHIDHSTREENQRQVNERRREPKSVPGGHPGSRRSKETPVIPPFSVQRWCGAENQVGAGMILGDFTTAPTSSARKKKMSCPLGHPYSPENTLVRMRKMVAPKNGRTYGPYEVRECRCCRAISTAIGYYHKGHKPYRKKGTAGKYFATLTAEEIIKIIERSRGL